MINFYDVACDLRLASNQVEAIRSLLCIKEDTFVDGKTLKIYAPDFPAAFRDWIQTNKPEVVFFAWYSLEQHYIDDDYEYNG